MTKLVASPTSKDGLDTVIYEQAEVQGDEGQFQLTGEAEENSWWNLLAPPGYDMLPVWDDVLYLPTNTYGNMPGIE
jgi:hypothetical protein